jgi:hypothetical protein
MANQKDEQKATAMPSRADLAEQAGRTPQVMEAAKTPAEHDKATLSEEPPKPNPDTEAKPAADANPDEVMGEGDSWPNYLSTAGLNARQKANVEGTPLDGANGGIVLGARATRVPDREERRAARMAEAQKSTKKSDE